SRSSSAPRRPPSRRSTPRPCSRARPFGKRSAELARVEAVPVSSSRWGRGTSSRDRFRVSDGASRPTATAFQLVFITYADLSSRAYGLEEMVSASGPGMAILTLAVLPFVWAAPLSLACAELSARFPVEGGYYRWARLAFGEFTGYLAGWLTWLAIFA